MKPIPPRVRADLRIQFIAWAKQHGHSPATGAESFVREMDLENIARDMGMVPGPAARQALRDDLAALAEDSDVAVQFPPIYEYASRRGIHFRYSLMLVIAEDCVEWTARVWRGMDYLGLVVGRGGGTRANYTRLARMAIEDELERSAPRFALH